MGRRATAAGRAATRNRNRRAATARSGADSRAAPAGCRTQVGPRRSEQRRSRPGCVRHAAPFSLDLWHFIAGSPSGAGDAELAGGGRRGCHGASGHGRAGVPSRATGATKSVAPDTPAPVPQPGPRGVPLGSRRGGPRGGHRRRGGRRGSSLVVELREVGGEGRILGRPAVEAGLNACWWSGVPVGGRWTNPEPSTASEETAHGVQAPAGDVLAKRPDWQAWRRVW